MSKEVNYIDLELQNNILCSEKLVCYSPLNSVYDKGIVMSYREHVETFSQGEPILTSEDYKYKYFKNNKSIYRFSSYSNSYKHAVRLIKFK